MTRHEVVDQFVSGRIDRRTFINRLTALGVSAAAAGVYAHSLVPSADAAPARDGQGFRVREGRFQEASLYPNPDPQRCKEIRARVAELNALKAQLTAEIAAETYKPRRVRLRRVRRSIQPKINLLRRKYDRDCR